MMFYLIAAAILLITGPASGDESPSQRPGGLHIPPEPGLELSGGKAAVLYNEMMQKAYLDEGE